jgi:hypothetical protein
MKNENEESRVPGEENVLANRTPWDRRRPGGEFDVRCFSLSNFWSSLELFGALWSRFFSSSFDVQRSAFDIGCSILDVGCFPPLQCWNLLETFGVDFFTAKSQLTNCH